MTLRYCAMWVLTGCLWNSAVCGQESTGGTDNTVEASAVELAKRLISEEQAAAVLKAVAVAADRIR